MPDEKLSLHVDTDWKRQAREEKERLIQQQASKAAAPAAVAPGGLSPAAGPASAATAEREAAGAPANFATLVQSILTQVLYYLGDISIRGGGHSVNLDAAKHQIDILGVLEEKTRGNLSDEEKHLLDTALYETRMRYVSVASQYT